MILITGSNDTVCCKVCKDLRTNMLFSRVSEPQSVISNIKAESGIRIVVICSDGAFAPLCKDIKTFDKSIVVIVVSGESAPSYLYVDNPYSDYLLSASKNSSELIKKLLFIYTVHFGIDYENLQIGAFSKKNGELFINGEIYSFSKYEKTILNFCIFNYPQYKTAESISDFCGIPTKSVPVIVSLLNKKAKLKYNHPLIKTKRGYGYMLYYIN